jgi:hypothetical protein
MAIPFNSVADQPQGLESVTINLIAYIVDSVDIPVHENRVISRTDANGDRADFMIRDGSDQIEGSMTLQRAANATDLPAVGNEFTYDYDNSGTASTLVVKDVKVARDKENFETFEITVVRKTYQG